MLDPGIVRNRLKIFSARTNAQAFLKVQKELGSFDAYLWDHVGGKPLISKVRAMGDVPVKTEMSDRISRDLLKSSFKFVGSPNVYAYLQAGGVINALGRASCRTCVGPYV